MAVWCTLCGKFITSNTTCKIKNDKFRKYLISRYLLLLNLFYSNLCLVVVADLAGGTLIFRIVTSICYTY